MWLWLREKQWPVSGLGRGARTGYVSGLGWDYERGTTGLIVRWAIVPGLDLRRKQNSSEGKYNRYIFDDPNVPTNLNFPNNLNNQTTNNPKH